MKVGVFGATGPVGRRVTGVLLERGVDVRVVSRSRENLARDFGELAVETFPADLEDRESALAAARGCDRVIHAVGLPVELFDRHVPIARNTVDACESAGALPFLVTSYWSYGPGDETPMAESRPRREGSGKAAIREREEEVFLDAGGAVARLPDFYGPEPGVSLLNDALDSLRVGDFVRWPGDPDAPRDFLHYADAGRLLVELALEDAAYGEPWNVPGSGAVTPRELLRLVARRGGVKLRLRRLRPWMARVAGLFREDARAFLDILPLYDAPAVLDCAKLQGLLGPVETVPYERGLPETLQWLSGR